MRLGLSRLELRCATGTSKQRRRVGRRLAEGRCIEGIPDESSWVWVTHCGCQGSGGAWSLGEDFWLVFTACCDMLLRVLCSVRPEQWQLCYSGSNIADLKSFLALLLLFCYFLPVALWQQTFVIQLFSVGTILSRAVGRDAHSATTAGFCCLTAVSQKHDM